MSMEDRVGKVEDGLSRLSSEVRVQGHDIAGLKTDVSKITSGVEKLLERDARRPDALSWQKVAATAITTLTILGGMSWLVGGAVEHAPAVRALAKRMDYAEWKYGWATHIDEAR